jgi:hypothetical protein
MVSYRPVLVAALGLVVLAATAREVSWRTTYFNRLPPIPGPSWYAAEVRTLPEGSLLPYGSGVFLYLRLVPLRSVSATLVFVGYCGDTQLNWLSPNELQIVCGLAEGEPKVVVPILGNIRVSMLITSRRGS